MQVLLAFAAGTLALLSPCTLPIRPGVMSAVRGGGSTGSLPRAIGLAASFALGASIVLVGSVALALAFSVRVDLTQPPFSWIAGALLIVAGLAALGYVKIRVPQGTNLDAVAPWVKAPLLGMTLAAVWYPCLGPSLAMIYGLGSQISTVPVGIGLGFAYFLGLVTPLVLFGLLFARFGRQRVWARRVGRYVNVALSCCLLVIGLLVLTGLWGPISTWIVSQTAGTTLL